MKPGLLIVALALGGCALNPGEHWERAGASAHDLRMDEARCENDSLAAVVAYPGVGAPIAQAGYVRNCMIGRGWEPTRNK